MHSVLVSLVFFYVIAGKEKDSIPAAADIFFPRKRVVKM